MTAFKDYYSLLEIGPEVSPDILKKAFYAAAKKWHPDKYKGADATQKMQDINEAFLILKDAEAKARYDIVYRQYKQFELAEEMIRNTTASDFENGSAKRASKATPVFTFEDDLLARWMYTASNQAKGLAKEMIDELRRGFREGGGAFFEEAGKGIFRFLIFSIVIGIIFKACNQ